MLLDLLADGNVWSNTFVIKNELHKIRGSKNTLNQKSVDIV